MGLTVCEVHGRIGFVEACAHIADELSCGRMPSGHRFTIMGNLLLCDDCFRSLGFDRLASLAELPLERVIQVDDGRMEAFEAAYEKIEGRRHFCSKCVADLESHHDTSSGA
jgi:hypothetical protein